MARILVVDDQEQVVALVSKILLKAGHVAVTARGAEAAVELCSTDAPFDVIVSDVLMPGMDGHALARWLAEHYPHSRVILMSAFDPGCDNCAYLEKCYRITKPFTSRQLLGLISEALGQPRTRRPEL